MKAVFIRKYGGIDVLEYGELPRPVPKKGQVLVKVAASSINPRDWLLREGKYVFKYFTRTSPIVLGSDISGVVVEAGPGTTRFRVGDEVFGMQTPLGGMGAYAEYIAIAESALAAKPANISHEEAAGVPCAAITAYAALVRIAQVRSRDRVTIIGASGGVGTYSVQIAKALGAEVAAVTSTANIELAQELGADTVIDYKQERFSARLSDQQVVFDTIGREHLGSCRATLTRQGRYITTIPNFINLRQSLSSQLTRLLRLGNAPSAHIVLAPSSGRILSEIAAWMEQQKVRTIIDSVYPLSDIKAAHQKSRTWRARGKIILAMP